MNQSLVNYTAAIFGLALSLVGPASAQSLGSPSAEFCWNRNGHLVCQPPGRGAAASGPRAYERWDNGSPAQSSGSSAAAPVQRGDSRSRFYSGAYNSFYGFGR